MAIETTDTRSKAGPQDWDRVLYLIKSATGNSARRDEQESRWLRALPEGSAYYFCLGGEESGRARVDGRILFLPVPAGYNHLPSKMKAMVEWASGADGFDYIVTMDDDVVLDAARFHEFLKHKPDHFGNMWDSNPRHVSGMLVGYSQRAFAILNDLVHSLPDTGPDDLLVSNVVYEPFRDLNVMTDHERFVPYGGPLSSATVAAEVRPFRLGAIKGFRFDLPRRRNRVSFCLFGNDPKYVKGAIINVGLVHKYYPGWEPVFHTRDVEISVIEELRSLGATVVECTYRNMMLARFLPFCDEGVVLSRDCDSRIGPREQRAVNEWLATDMPAHLIRDHPEHLPGWALIPGGLWGSRLPFGNNLRAALERALHDPQYGGWGGDQRWLVENVWRSDGFTIHQYDQVNWMHESWDPEDFCGMSQEVHQEFEKRQVVLFEGFFNRLNGLVNAWLTFGPGFRATWSVNAHLPHPSGEFFSSMPGVVVTEVQDLGYWPENTDPASGPLCYWFVSRRCGATAAQVEAAYRHFISKLKVGYNANPPPLGVHYRGLHHSARVSPAEFAEWCLAHAQARNLRYCFLVADAGRDEIVRILSAGGLVVSVGASSPLAHDLDRLCADELRRFIGDAITLAHCTTVLTSFEESTVIDPARAYGREVIACTGSRAWSECWFTHRAPELH